MSTMRLWVKLLVIFAGGAVGTGLRIALLRLVGDDATYVERPGPTSPPFPGHGMQPGQRLREDWFPILLDRGRGAVSA